MTKKIRRGLKKVRKRIKSYKYRRKDGHVIKVASHLRTYWKNPKVRKTAYYTATIVLPKAFIYRSYLKDLIRERKGAHIPNAPQIKDVQEIEDLAKAIGVKNVPPIRGKEIFTIKSPAYAGYSPIENVLYVPITEEGEKILPYRYVALHELGHAKIKEKLGKKTYLFGSLLPGTYKALKVHYILPLLPPSKRRKVLVAVYTPEIIDEALATYYGAKKAGVELTKEEKKQLAEALGLRIADAIATEGISQATHELLTLLRNKRQNRKLK